MTNENKPWPSAGSTFALQHRRRGRASPQSSPAGPPEHALSRSPTPPPTHALCAGHAPHRHCRGCGSIAPHFRPSPPLYPYAPCSQTTAPVQPALPPTASLAIVSSRPAKRALARCEPCGAPPRITHMLTKRVEPNRARRLEQTCGTNTFKSLHNSEAPVANPATILRHLFRRPPCL